MEKITVQFRNLHIPARHKLRHGDVIIFGNEKVGAVTSVDHEMESCEVIGAMEDEPLDDCVNLKGVVFKSAEI